MADYAEVWQKTTKFCKAKINILKMWINALKKKKELNFDYFIVFRNLKQIGRVKNLISGYFMSWQKKIIFNVIFSYSMHSNEPFLHWIVTRDKKWIL